MAIIERLASSLGRRDEEPNKELAAQIAGKKDKNAIKELVANLSAKNSAIQSDCIKVLYEVGEHDPSLISEYIKDFIALLDNKNNRLQWGAMTAISAIAPEGHKEIYGALSKIVDTADKGSVITKDHAVKILVKLGAMKQYADDAFTLLSEQILNSPVNQLPSYAEQAMGLITEKNRGAFIKTLNARLPDVESETKRKRIEKVIKKIGK